MSVNSPASFKLSDPRVADLAEQTLRKIWKYMAPCRGRFALSIVLGMFSAVFNDIMLIGFQLIFSLVLKDKTRTHQTASHRQDRSFEDARTLC